MNFLIIINHTESNHFFFSRLGEHLKKRGHKVCYSLEARVNNFFFGSQKITKNVYFFTDYILNSSDIGELPSTYNNINIWEIFFSDFDRFENFNINLNKNIKWYQSIAISRLKYFETIYSNENIDAVIFEPISSSINYFAYIVSKNQGIKYLGLVPSRIPNRYRIDTGPDSIKKNIKQNYDKIINNQIHLTQNETKIILDYLASFEHSSPDYMTQYDHSAVSPIKKYLHLKNIKNIFNSIRYLLSNCEKNFPFEVGNPLIYSLRMFERTAKRYIKNKFINKYYANITNEEENFFLYPLHFHPESSTSILARHYVDEYVVIKNIAFNLPFGFILYVKDHPSAVGYPPLEFYKKIKRLPNVKIISPNNNTKKLIKKSSGVVTLTSTVGFEAIILDKPVIVLGDVFYDFYPTCFKINSWDELFPILNQTKTVKADKNDTLNFISAYFLSTYEGTLIMDKRYEKYDSLIDNIIKHLKND